MNHIPKLLLAVLACAIILFTGVLITAWFLGSPSKGKTLAQAAGIPRPAVIAHRGASYLAPEETRAAYLMARELGVDYLEFDVQRTKDDVLIALHDDSLSRTSNVAQVFPAREKDMVDTFTFAELQQLDVGEWFNQRFPERARKTFAGLRILRFEDIVEIAEGASNEIGLFIELKSAHRFPGIEQQLVEGLRKHGWIDRPRTSGHAALIFQSFEPESLERLKLLAPDMPRLLLVDDVLIDKLGWDGVLKTATEAAMGIGTWGYQWASGSEWSQKVRSRYMTTWPWYTGEAHRAGLFVYPWTIDDRWEMLMVTMAGADGIFTNRSELALKVYGRAVPSSDFESLWRQIKY